MYDPITTFNIAVCFSSAFLPIKPSNPIWQVQSFFDLINLFLISQNYYHNILFLLANELIRVIVSFVLQQYYLRQLNGLTNYSSGNPSFDMEITRTVEDLSQKAHLPTPTLKNIAGFPFNVMITGRGGNDLLLIGDNWQHSEEGKAALKAFIAHELGHMKHMDAFKQKILFPTVTSLTRVGVQLALNSAMGFALLTPMIAEWSMRIVSALFIVLNGYLYLAHSRRNEYRCDKFGAELLGDKRQLIDAIKFLGTHHEITKINDQSGAPEVHMSHPTTQQRIEALEKNN